MQNAVSENHRPALVVHKRARQGATRPPAGECDKVWLRTNEDVGLLLDWPIFLNEKSRVQHNNVTGDSTWPNLSLSSCGGIDKHRISWTRVVKQKAYVHRERAARALIGSICRCCSRLQGRKNILRSESRRKGCETSPQHTRPRK